MTGEPEGFVLNADVLVLGGGPAGAWAAEVARQMDLPSAEVTARGPSDMAWLKQTLSERVVAALAGVSLGYLIMLAIVFDYSRWISNWAVCIFLLLHVVKTLPAAELPPLTADDRRTQAFGWIVTLIPRVGIVRPF